MRQLIRNLKQLIKRMEQRTGAILSVDTEGGHRMTELGWALHRWFRVGEDLIEPAVNRALDPFEKDLAAAIQASLQDRHLDLDPDETITPATPTSAELRQETIIRHFYDKRLKAIPKQFLLGDSEHLTVEHVRQRLDGIFNAVQLHQNCLLLIAHAPYAELYALQFLLDVDTSNFKWLDGSTSSTVVQDPKGIIVLDTQQLMQCYQKSSRCLSLHDACTAMQIDTHKLHNAGQFF